MLLGLTHPCAALGELRTQLLQTLPDLPGYAMGFATHAGRPVAGVCTRVGPVRCHLTEDPTRQRAYAERAPSPPQDR
jgi:hypothetical protein